MATIATCASVWAADTIMSSTVSSSGTVTVDKTPNTAASPSIMINQQDTCLVGISGAAQTAVIGISGGTTQRDENCERIKLSRQMFSMGMKVAAVAIMCQDERVFGAMEQSGTPCPVQGLIGSAAGRIWEATPEARPDYNLIKDKADLRGKQAELAKVIESERAEKVRKAKEEQAAQAAKEAAEEAKLKADRELQERKDAEARVKAARKLIEKTPDPVKPVEMPAQSSTSSSTVIAPAVIATPLAAPVKPEVSPNSVVKKNAQPVKKNAKDGKCDPKDAKDKDCKKKPDAKKDDKKPDSVVKKPKDEHKKDEHKKPVHPATYVPEVDEIFVKKFIALKV